jgi:putative transferase (TIGR04331 family)
MDLDGTRRQAYRLALVTRLIAVPWLVAPRWTFALGLPRFDAARLGLARVPSANEFERILARLLPRLFPTLYMEHYREAQGAAVRAVGALPRVLVSANGWLAHEPFKFLAAEAAERGRRLVAAQHGGGYGICRAIPLETHETRAADAFLVWGWAGTGAVGLVDVPSIKLSVVRPPRRRRRGRAILYVGNDYPRYLYRFQSTPMGSHLEEYFQWQERFLAALPAARRRDVLFRGHPANFGNDARCRVTSIFPEVSRGDGIPFGRRLRQCRVVVIDNLSTTLLEALVADVPTILFWDPNRWEPRDEAADSLGALRVVGVLHDSPEEAARALERVYDDPRAWWRRREVQTERCRFIGRYALARRSWTTAWSGVLATQAALAP